MPWCQLNGTTTKVQTENQKDPWVGSTASLLSRTTPAGRKKCKPASEKSSRLVGKIVEFSSSVKASHPLHIVARLSEACTPHQSHRRTPRRGVRATTIISSHASPRRACSTVHVAQPPAKSQLTASRLGKSCDNVQHAALIPDLWPSRAT